MSEVWAVAVAAGGAYMQSRQASKDRKDDQNFNREMSAEGARNQARLNRFDAELSDYYSQLNRSRKQRGLDNIRQFSQLGRIAPGYAQESERIDPGTKPDPEAVLPAQPPQQSGGSGRSTMDRLIDPLGLF